MKPKFKNNRLILLIPAVILVLLTTSFFLTACTAKTPRTGQIYLYGEEHGVERIMDKELELWSACYRDAGMRDLFVELPNYTAEFLNLWMQSDNDEILLQLYEDWEGAAVHTPEVLDFYRQIKKLCPETVFHGTDVGHQYETTGRRYLEYLASTGQEQSELYQLTQETIEQGRHYYQNSDHVYRENAMVKNFIRELDQCNDVSVMGIYGSAHTDLDGTDYSTNTIPCMANQLKQHYGDSVVHSENLTLLSNPERVDSIRIGGKEYTALYYGKADLSAVLPDFQFREFWRVEDAYEDFKDNPVTGNVLPYNNYPMKIETGQIFIIEYTKKDGSVFREYHRSAGNTWQGSPATEEFQVSE